MNGSLKGKREVREFSWIIFAGGQKPTSMGRAIAERISQNEKVTLLGLAVSVRQERAIPPLQSRAIALPVNRNLVHYRPLHFPEKLPGMGRILRSLNERLIQREIDKLLSPQMDRIVCYDSPTQYALVKKFREKQSLYLAIDDRTLTVCGNPIAGEQEAERKLLGKVDMVICVSAPLAEILRERLPKGRSIPIHVLPNAYDERIFNTERELPEPSFLQEIPRPRILVSGHITERIDWIGIISSSRLRGEWKWIFVGPADEGMPEKIQKNLNGRGIYHPLIPVEEMPAWIYHCDACAVPYRLNPFTQASHPLKAIEYLAMGKPVLSTRVPSLKCYDGVMHWVEEGVGESYTRMLAQISWQDRDPEIEMLRRRAVAKDSWDARFDQFRNIICNPFHLDRQ